MKKKLNVIEVVPVILCGGSGTRLWPLSRESYPKQFLSLDDVKLSLFQQTLKRIDGLICETNIGQQININDAVVVANEAHRFLVLDQLHEIQKNADILLEPEGKNTAPSLTLAALHITEKYSDNVVMLVLPADHFIEDDSCFCQSIQQAINIAINDATIVTLGIEPTEPATGYGYISYTTGKDSVYFVERFVEKPDYTTAESYIASGHYVWNSGIFVLSVATWLDSIGRFHQTILETTSASWEQHRTDNPFIRPDASLFNHIPNESIDYAVMEHAPLANGLTVKMIKLQVSWNDLGTWQAIHNQSSTSGNSLVTEGDVIAIDSHDSYIKSSGRLVATLGVKDLIVVETPDAVLVVDKSCSQDVKKIVTELKLQGREEQSLHRKTYRPWGWYDSIDEGKRFKVKRISVKPKASLSLQKHHHRAEHWVVVKGTAEVTCGDKTSLLTENQSTYIPLGEVHRLSNPGTIPLEIIEVQSGSYLGEDDIVRLDDVYGRSD